MDRFTETYLKIIKEASELNQNARSNYGIVYIRDLGAVEDNDSTELSWLIDYHKELGDGDESSHADNPKDAKAQLVEEWRVIWDSLSNEMLKTFAEDKQNKANFYCAGVQLVKYEGPGTNERRNSKGQVKAWKFYVEFPNSTKTPDEAMNELKEACYNWCNSLRKFAWFGKLDPKELFGIEKNFKWIGAPEFPQAIKTTTEKIRFSVDALKDRFAANAERYANPIFKNKKK